MVSSFLSVVLQNVLCSTIIEILDDPTEIPSLPVAMTLVESRAVWAKMRCGRTSVMAGRGVNRVEWAEDGTKADFIEIGHKPRCQILTSHQRCLTVLSTSYTTN